MATDNSFEANKLPRWQQRRWRLLQAVLVNPDFKKLLPDFAADYQANGNLPTQYTFALFHLFEIPNGCAGAIYWLMEYPERIDQEAELVKRIKPPVSFWSYKAKMLAPSDNPVRNFIIWQRERKKLLREKNVDLLELHEGLLLQVEPYTTKEELKSFIDSHWDDMHPLLQLGEEWQTPAALRSGRIKATDELAQKMLALREQGKTAFEIMQELKIAREPSSINRTIARYKRKNNT